MNRISRMMSLAVAVSAASGFSIAQPADHAAEPAKAAAAPAQGELPSGWDVLEREVEVVGGKDKYMKLENVVATGKFSMAAMGIEGTISRTEVAPNKLRMDIELGVMGTMIQCTDGHTVWMIPPGQTEVTIADGEMAEAMIQRADFYARIHPRKTYASAEVVGIEEINGVSCYRVSLVPKEGTDSVGFFNIETGHRIKSMARSSKDAEVFDIISEMSDFREVNGITHAFVIKQKSQGNEFVITMESVEHNAQVDNAIFSPPSEL